MGLERVVDCPALSLVGRVPSCIPASLHPLPTQESTQGLPDLGTKKGREGSVE